MRKTEKYLKACQLLDVEPGHLPHELLYGMLIAKGWNWDGSMWRPDAKDIRWTSASLRVSASDNDVVEIALALAEVLEGAGAQIGKISQPFQNRDGQQTRIYINFRYPTKGA
jgi:hypothetical protein